jgi:hypothetical protein
VRGLTPPGARPDRQTFEFRQGIGGYEECAVVELRAAPGASDQNHANPPAVIIHGPGADQRQALLRFDRLFGTEPFQIPPGSEVRSASLRLWVEGEGRELVFRRVLGPWSADYATWDNVRLLGNREPGVQGDDVEAARLSQTLRAGSPAVLDVTADVRRWARGEPNFGWAVSATDAAGATWHAAAAENAVVRPLLTIEFTPPQPGRVTAVGNVYRTLADKPLLVPAGQGVLSDDWFDGELTAAPLGKPRYGSVDLRSDGSFVYTPKPGFVGRDSFRYRANSTHLDSEATVWIIVE